MDQANTMDDPKQRMMGAEFAEGFLKSMKVGEFDAKSLMQCLRG